MTTPSLPILYSFRRCPYAMRARLAIVYAKQSVELREVVLKDKPAAMLATSPKATVPVLQLVSGQVIDESRDVMLWALGIDDPAGLLDDGKVPESTTKLLDENDREFKHWLDRYKYADRYPEESATSYRERGEIFLGSLESKLAGSSYLCGERVSIADIGVMPFVRQFAMVDKAWFDEADYPALRRWLYEWLEAPEFKAIMKKYTAWRVGQECVLFSDSSV